MSTFLELVRDLSRQSGTLAGGVTLATVADVTGRADKMVYWTKTAWEDVQNQRAWNFLKGEFEDALVSGTKRYTAADLNLTRFKTWEVDTPFWQPLSVYDPAVGAADENSVRQIPYDTWRNKYDRRTHDAGRPLEYAISPSLELCVGPTPDKNYVVRGGYIKSPQVLAIDADIPESPAHLHQIIVHRAMVLMGGADESPITITTAQNEFRRLFVVMCEEQLPDINMTRGNALA